MWFTSHRYLHDCKSFIFIANSFRPLVMYLLKPSVNDVHMGLALLVNYNSIANVLYSFQVEPIL